MFNLKKKLQDKVEEVKEDITDNLDMAIIGAAGAIIVSYFIGCKIGSNKPNTNLINVTIVERERDLINNIIVNK